MDLLKKATNSKLYKDLMSLVMKIFIVLTFFFPAFYSNFDKKNYFIGFLWPYAFLIVFMLFVILKHGFKKWELKKVAISYLVIILFYSIATIYVNNVYHHWMWEEIHNVIAFVFLILLLIYPDIHKDLNFDLFRFLIQCIVLSIICSIVLYFMGYERIQICNNLIELKKLPENFYETRMSWIYYHKSQFGMMQLIYLGFCYNFRHKFESMIRFYFAELVFLIALVLSHSWASLLASSFILLGIFLDSGILKKLHWKKKYLKWVLLFGIVITAIMFFTFRKFLAERDILSLGYRIPIWKVGIKYILDHPMGVGKEFGKGLLDAGVFTTNNCHNVFLNAMYRFSIPVGLLYNGMLFLFFTIMIRIRKSFFAVGYILSILSVMMIDYSLLSYGLASFLMLIYYTLSCKNDVMLIQKGNG